MDRTAVTIICPASTRDDCEAAINAPSDDETGPGLGPRTVALSVPLASAPVADPPPTHYACHVTVDTPDLDRLRAICDDHQADVEVTDEWTGPGRAHTARTVTVDGEERRATMHAHARARGLDRVDTGGPDG